MLKLIKKYKYILTLIIFILIIFVCIVRSNMLKEKNIEFSLESKQDIVIEEVNDDLLTNEKIKMLKIDIKGQVVNPGVYELEEDSRIIDAINIAGGLTENANTSLINLSKKLEDSMVIIIYSNEEVANSNVKEIETVFKLIEKECDCPAIENDGCINTEISKEDGIKDNNESSNELVNINTASKEELMTISGIGEAKADSIIEYRNNNKFNTIEDVMNVSGIGESLFEKIKAYITV